MEESVSPGLTVTRWMEGSLETGAGATGLSVGAADGIRRERPDMGDLRGAGSAETIVSYDVPAPPGALVRSRFLLVAQMRTLVLSDQPPALQIMHQPRHGGVVDGDL